MYEAVYFLLGLNFTTIEIVTSRINLHIIKMVGPSHDLTIVGPASLHGIYLPEANVQWIGTSTCNICSVYRYIYQQPILNVACIGISTCTLLLFNTDAYLHVSHTLCFPVTYMASRMSIVNASCTLFRGQMCTAAIKYISLPPVAQ